MTEESRRLLNSFSRVPTWNSTVSEAVANEVYESCGGSVFCNGMLREVVITPITSTLFKINTKAI